MFTRDDIQAEYERLKYEKGWTFMACPEARLRAASVAIVGLNPGGGGDGDDWSYGDRWSCEEVTDFGFDGTRMAGQVRAWGEVLNLDWDDVLCAEFIPFRSPDMKRLGNQAGAIRFARELWSWVLDVSPATLFITMGKDAAWYLAELMHMGPAFAHCPTGWGKQMIDVYQGGGMRIVAMPHPSRYALFGRGEVSATAAQSLRAAADRG